MTPPTTAPTHFSPVSSSYSSNGPRRGFDTDVPLPDCLFPVKEGFGGYRCVALPIQTLDFGSQLLQGNSRLFILHFPVALEIGRAHLSLFLDIEFELRCCQDSKVSELVRTRQISSELRRVQPRCGVAGRWSRYQPRNALFLLPPLLLSFSPPRFPSTCPSAQRSTAV